MHLCAGGLGDLDTRCGIAAEQAPAHSLLKRGVEHGVSIANCPWRELFLVHLVVDGLQIERCKARELALAQCWANGTGEQRLVVREGLLSQFRTGGDLQPAVEELVEGHLRTHEFPYRFALGQAGVENVLGGTEGAVDGAAVVRSSAGYRIAPLVHAHQPPVVAAGDDLTLPSRQAPSFRLKNLAHNWHTGLANLPVVCGFRAGVD